MSDELSNADIALLCDIAQLEAARLTGEKKRRLTRLLDAGYVESGDARPGQAGTPLKLTAKGVDFLGKRGAGLNEA